MKLISWNVNGIRACMGKGFLEVLKELDADIFCIQERQAEVPAEGYFQYWCSAEKKGYSGTALFTKKEPQSVSYGIGVDVHDHEGRVITAEYESFYLVNVYVPNSETSGLSNELGGRFPSVCLRVGCKEAGDYMRRYERCS